jgi:hypothetical protein
MLVDVIAYVGMVVRFSVVLVSVRETELEMVEVDETELGDKDDAELK